MSRTVVIIWQRFGPYHVARLRAAAARLGSEGFAVHGIEVAGKDNYAWNIVERYEVPRHCLFPDVSYGDLSSGEIKTAVAKKLDALQPAAVGINGWGVPEARSALSWCRRKGRKAILFSETKADERRRWWWKERMKAGIVRKFDAAVVGGRSHRDYVAQLGMEADKVFLGYDVVDNGYFVRGADEARRSCDPLPDPYFYANTRFIARKNVDGLIRAYARYRKEIGSQTWGLVISGSGPQEKALKDLASSLCPVTFPGFVQYDRLPWYYGRAGAFIHPAKVEPWGLVVNEACASGLPVLVSKSVGAGEELVREGENGWVFDPFNIEEMANSLVQMSRLSNEERARMGERSREIVAEWGPERFAEAFRQAMQGQLGKG
jgi:1,2-diacylglycerol 3-alpha-glucosyltransferase